MNAPQERGQEDFVNVQNIVMEDEITREGVAPERLLAFVLENAPLFRFFAEHLPDELRATWEKAESDQRSRTELVQAYAAFRAHIAPFIEDYVAQLDPDALTELTAAVDDGRIDFVSNLIENWVTLNAKQKERVEE